jgi:hypothetical protein
MLKLKLLWGLIKSNWKIPIYLIMVFIAFKFYWNIRQDLKSAERREHNLKSEMIERFKKDSLAIVKKAEIIDSLEGVILARAEIKIKPDTIKITTTGTKHGDWINFEWEDNCFFSWGWFEDREPYRLEQFIYQKPFSLDIIITDLKPDIYGIVRPSNNCVNIESVNFQSAPDLKGACRCGFDKGDFFLGAGIAGTLFLLFNIFNN